MLIYPPSESNSKRRVPKNLLTEGTLELEEFFDLVRHQQSNRNENANLFESLADLVLIPTIGTYID